MAEQRDDDRKADDQAPQKPPKEPGAGGSGIDDRTSRAQEEAAKDRAKEGGYQ